MVRGGVGFLDQHMASMHEPAGTWLHGSSQNGKGKLGSMATTRRVNQTKNMLNLKVRFHERDRDIRGKYQTESNVDWALCSNTQAMTAAPTYLDLYQNKNSAHVA